MNNQLPILVLLCVAGACTGLVSKFVRDTPVSQEYNTGTFEKNPTGSADVGLFKGVTSNFTGYEGFYREAADNVARAGDGIAVAGTRLFFRGDTTIQDAVFQVANIAEDNFAKSSNDNAVAGSQSVFSAIDNSTVLNIGYSFNNKAVVIGEPAPGESIAISGSQAQFAGPITNSSIYSVGDAVFSEAKNKGSGDAVAGSEHAFGSIVDDSKAYIYGYSDFAYARADDGDAVAGLKVGASYIADSAMAVYSDIKKNEARAIGGNAVAGSEHNFGSVVGSFPGGQADIVIGTSSIFNKAVTDGNGTAVAGATVNIEDAQNAEIDILSTAAFNIARARVPGTVAQNAVAGLAVTVNEMDDTTLTIDSVNAYNYARNKASGSEDDAIAGFQLTAGNVQDSEIIVEAVSAYNYAVAESGDAIAGNEVSIGYADSDTIVALDLNATNNAATSNSGNAIITSNVDIGGDARIFYP
eukprot:TRINITY_DN283_c0_g1_i4.p1 TRINITY_DN283_c0_g1~~TRINITY_DN283_c0_g1_i4.p1  ORF type:complete len:468 (+),score=124.79 TRINITY_DN283_c0_g1_i4:151-1554(+)